MTSCHHKNHQKCIADALQQAEQVCHNKGLRFTELRRKVFEIIWQSHKALTAADIMTMLGNDQPPTTYRALEFLTENGLIHRIASLNAFVGCVQPEDEEHIGQLLICSDCHNVTELKESRPVIQLARAAQERGFQVQQTHIEMLGRCHTCHGVAA